jgi:hypothetical protein
LPSNYGVMIKSHLGRVELVTQHANIHCFVAFHNHLNDATIPFIHRRWVVKLLVQRSFLKGRPDKLETQGTLDHANRSEGLRLESIHWKGTRCGDLGLVRALAVEFVHGHAATFNHAFLCLADPHTGVIKFLVGLIWACGVSNLTLQVVMLVLFKFAQTIPVCPLSVGINVHLDNTVFNGTLDLVIGRTGSTVHDQEDGLVPLTSQLFLRISLVLSKALGLQADISWLVHSMYISKGGGNGEHVSNFGELVIDGIDLFRAGVKLLGVDCGRVGKMGLRKLLKHIS